MEIKKLTSSMGDNEFYPTPKELAAKMLAGVQWGKIETILEPSAGKGDLVDAVLERIDSYRLDFEIDCVELDPNLRAMLKGKGYRVIHDDFLTLHTYKKYDLIVMNPPFSNGEKHLLKALQMQKKGGGIICLLNAETLRNPYSLARKELVKQLEEAGATIEYITESFVHAERRTNVEIALVRVIIPEVKEDSEIYRFMKNEHSFEEWNHVECTDLVLGDFIKAAVSQYNVEVASGVELIRQYQNLKPYMMDTIQQDNYAKPILTLTLQGKDLSINKYVQATRYKYWYGLFGNKKFTGRFTSNLINEYRGMIRELQNYDFSVHNINMILLDMNEKMNDKIEDAIMEMFDRLSNLHAWHQESNNNVHYYNGWATNKAHKVNKKVILPCYGVFSSWSNSFQAYQAVDTLRDIEKIFDFFDGSLSREIDLWGVMNRAENTQKTRNLECKYFTVTFYKKGTMHITFKNLDLLEKFNIYAAKNRKWLPPAYGKKYYSEMTKDEQAVVDDFQGEKAYNQVMKNQNYFLVETNDFYALSCS